MNLKDSSNCSAATLQVKYLFLFNPWFFLRCFFSLETVVMPQAAAVHGFHHHGCSQPRLYRIDFFPSFISMTGGGLRLCLPFPLLATHRHRWLQRVKSSFTKGFNVLGSRLRAECSSARRPASVVVFSIS